MDLLWVNWIRRLFTGFSPGYGWSDPVVTLDWSGWTRFLRWWTRFSSFLFFSNAISRRMETRTEIKSGNGVDPRRRSRAKSKKARPSTTTATRTTTTTTTTTERWTAKGRRRRRTMMMKRRRTTTAKSAARPTTPSGSCSAIGTAPFSPRNPTRPHPWESPGTEWNVFF